MRLLWGQCEEPPGNEVGADRGELGPGVLIARSRVGRSHRTIGRIPANHPDRPNILVISATSPPSRASPSTPTAAVHTFMDSFAIASRTFCVLAVSAEMRALSVQRPHLPD